MKYFLVIVFAVAVLGKPDFVEDDEEMGGVFADTDREEMIPANSVHKRISSLPGLQRLMAAENLRQKLQKIASKRGDDQFQDNILATLSTVEQVSHKVIEWLANGATLQDIKAVVGPKVTPIINKVISVSTALTDLISEGALKDELKAVSNILPDLLQALHGSRREICYSCAWDVVNTVMNTIATVGNVRNVINQAAPRMEKPVWAGPIANLIVSAASKVHEKLTPRAYVAQTHKSSGPISSFTVARGLMNLGNAFMKMYS